MKTKRLLKAATAAVLSLAIVFSVGAGTVPAKAESLSDLQQKQASLKQQSKALDAKIQKLKGDQAQLQQY